MGDRPRSSSRERMSEDKVRRKDWCWSVRAVYVLGKLSDVSGPGLKEAGRYNNSLKTFHVMLLDYLGYLYLQAMINLLNNNHALSSLFD